MKKNNYIYTIKTVMDFLKGQDPHKSMHTGYSSVIAKWLNEMDITEYSISEDFGINVFEKVDITGKLKKNTIPYKFLEVTGGFYCSDNGLLTLVNSPKIIHNGSLICVNNSLKNLIGGPQTVDSYYVVSNNKLTTLEGIAQKISGTIAINNNKLTSLKGCPEEVFGDFYCQYNDLKNLDYLPNKIHGILYISYIEKFKTKQSFIDEIHKRCIAEEIKIM